MKAIGLASVLLFACLANAQDYPKAEIFGGYSFLHIDTQGIDGATLDDACNTLVGPGSCPAGTFLVKKNFSGWNAAAQVNVNRWVGIKADFSGHYGKPLTLSSSAQSFLDSLGITIPFPNARSYSFVFGPVITSRGKRATPFAHALFGVNRVSTDAIPITVSGIGTVTIPSASDDAFAMAFGGGVDVRLTDRFSVRLGQADYLYTGHDFSFGAPGVASHQNNYRFSAGIVITFGGKKDPTTPGQPSPPIVAGVEIPSLGAKGVTASRGVELVSVPSGSPAAAAGMQARDVVVAVDDKPVATPEELQSALLATTPGSAKITYMIRGAWKAEKVIELR